MPLSTQKDTSSSQQDTLSTQQDSEEGNDNVREPNSDDSSLLIPIFGGVLAIVCIAIVALLVFLKVRKSKKSETGEGMEMVEKDETMPSHGSSVASASEASTNYGPVSVESQRQSESEYGVLAKRAQEDGIYDMMQMGGTQGTIGAGEANGDFASARYQAVPRREPKVGAYASSQQAQPSIGEYANAPTPVYDAI